MLREIAAEISGSSKGPDPIALLVDPSPEELAEWKREAPQAEIVAAAQARHAGDALAQAVRRAESGEEVILLVDSLSKLEDADVASEIFDGGRGRLTVVAALVRE
jgi:transcription termination factor Rho